MHVASFENKKQTLGYDYGKDDDCRNRDRDDHENADIANMPINTAEHIENRITLFLNGRAKRSKAKQSDEAKQS